VEDDATPECPVSIVLNEFDRELVWMAARLLMAQESGQTRKDAAEQLVQHYRDDLADAYPAVDPSALEEMTLNFGRALLLEMERISDDDCEHQREVILASDVDRPRLRKALRRMLDALDPRH
jgi:hypothetical protein